MANTQNLNSITKEVFTVDRLVLIRDAIIEVFDIFQGLLEKPVYAYADVKHRLDAVEDSKWQKIRSRIFDSDYTGFKSEDLSKDEKNTVIYVLLKFIRAVDKCTATITKKLETKDSETTEMETKMRELEGKLRATDELVQSTKSCYSQKCSENSGLIGKNTHLQEVINEKNRKLIELEKSSNVMLWEKEKNRILKESDDRIAELENELAELKSGRENYRRRMSNIDESHKRMMMKQQILNQRSPAPSDSGSDSDDLCRRNYILDKDVSYLEKELYDLQTNTVGVIGGIKTDFCKLTHKITGDSGVDKEFDQLSSRMDKVYHAISDGKVDKLAESLPPHYRYIENTNFRVKRIRRLSQTAIVPPQRVLNTMIEEKTKPKSNLNEINEDLYLSIDFMTEPEPLQYQQNPVIVMQKTRKLHPINPIKHFPHMSQQFILDQFDRFTEYDTNHDETLDLPEMVKVVSQLGFDFNAHQLQEAMEEVDKDHNHTLDFYEYLLIIDNIYRRRGKAELFKRGLTEMNKKNISKACVIQ